MDAKVSIIIPFYNCSYINEAIESALNQTYVNTEILVVDDGSTSHKDKLVPYLKNIKLIEKENGGTGSAINAGMNAATGDYFAWLSSDDVFMPNKIQDQLQFMVNNQSSISYTNYSLINEQSAITNERVGIHYDLPYEFIRHFQKGCHINGCTVMFKREVYENIGEFNTRYKYTQDYDYWLRVIQHYPFDYLDSPLTLYRVHEAMGSKQFLRNQTAEIVELRVKYKRILKELERRVLM